MALLPDPVEEFEDVDDEDEAIFAFDRLFVVFCPKRVLGLTTCCAAADIVVMMVVCW